MFTLGYTNASFNYILHITKISSVTILFLRKIILIHNNYQLIFKPLCTTFVKSETKLKKSLRIWMQMC